MQARSNAPTAKKCRLSTEIRNNRIQECQEDLKNIELQLKFAERAQEKFANIHQYQSTIGALKVIKEMKEKRRDILTELGSLQKKEAKSLCYKNKRSHKQQSFTQDTTSSSGKIEHVSDDTFYEEKLKTYTLFKANGVGKDYKITDGIYVSPLNNFTLDDFVIVRQLFCSGRHTNRCLECSRLLEFARLVKDGGIIEFAATYRTIYPHLVYKSDLAVRKMMQAPLCVFKMATMGPGSEKLYVTEKIAGVDYSSFITLTKKVWQTQKPSTTLDKTALKELCNLTSSEKDKLLVKYVCCKSQNLSMNKARQLYGFWNFNQQKEKTNNALLEMREIYDVIEELAAIKECTEGNTCDRKRTGWLKHVY